MKRLFLVLAVVATVVPNVARAQDKAACLDAASKGQRLRDQHRLVEAREKLRVCAAAQCPAVVQTDCAGWLAEVERTLPTVVLSAKDGTGADLIDVVVTVDGQPLTERLDGRSAPLDAGPHTFHFQRADGTGVDRQVVVREGAKDQLVSVILASATPAAPAPPPVAPPAPAAPSSQPPAPAPAPTEPHSSSPSTTRTLGWVLGGAGVVGLGVGTVFGLVALSDKSSAHCVNDVCDPGTTSGIKTAAAVSDIGWLTGGLLVAGGAALLLLSPSEHTTGASLRAAPMVAADGGGLVVGGRW